MFSVWKCIFVCSYKGRENRCFLSITDYKKKELVGKIFLESFIAREKKKFTFRLDYGIVFFLMPKVNIVLLQSSGWHSQREDIRVKSDSLFYSIYLSCILQGTHPVSVCRFLEICVCWICVIHNCFPVAPLEVIPFDSVAVGWQKKQAKELTSFWVTLSL